MQSWTSYTGQNSQHTVIGDLRVYQALYSPQLDNCRDILVWLPPSYEEGDRRYPVLYMHDGHNLFDAHASFSGEWRVDETMTELAGEGHEAIIVGLPNQGDMRFAEYNPYPAGSSGTLDGRGVDYVRYIIETVKSLIDASFRTLPGPASTGIAGSSMGGLISLYGFLVHPDHFGLCGAFSPAFWPGDRGLLRTIESHATGCGRIYLDVGTREGHVFAGLPAGRSVPAALDPDQAYLEGVRRLRDRLLSRGYSAGDTLLYVEEVGAIHHEDAWARRLPVALRFFLPR